MKKFSASDTNPTIKSKSNDDYGYENINDVIDKHIIAQNINAKKSIRGTSIMCFERKNGNVS